MNTMIKKKLENLLEDSFEHTEPEVLASKATEWLNENKIPYAFFPPRGKNYEDCLIIIPKKHEDALNAYMLNLSE